MKELVDREQEWRKQKAEWAERESKRQEKWKKRGDEWRDILQKIESGWKEREEEWRKREKEFTEREKEQKSREKEMERWVEIYEKEKNSRGERNDKAQIDYGQHSNNGNNSVTKHTYGDRGRLLSCPVEVEHLEEEEEEEESSGADDTKGHASSFPPSQSSRNSCSDVPVSRQTHTMSLSSSYVSTRHNRYIFNSHSTGKQYYKQANIHYAVPIQNQLKMTSLAII